MPNKSLRGWNVILRDKIGIDVDSVCPAHFNDLSSKRQDSYMIVGGKGKIIVDARAYSIMVKVKLYKRRCRW